jgi:hypothetical protein
MDATSETATEATCLRRRLQYALTYIPEPPFAVNTSYVANNPNPDRRRLAYTLLSLHKAQHANTPQAISESSISPGNPCSIVLSVSCHADLRMLAVAASHNSEVW